LDKALICAVWQEKKKIRKRNKERKRERKKKKNLLRQTIGSCKDYKSTFLHLVICDVNFKGSNLNESKTDKFSLAFHEVQQN